VFGYETAEDIAYKFRLLLQEHNVESETVEMRTGISNNDFTSTIQGLKAYFHNLKDGDEAKEDWKGLIYLTEQLYTCA
jgi:hypothetical protein